MSKTWSIPQLQNPPLSPPVALIFVPTFSLSLMSVFCFAVSASPSLLPGWGHHMHGLFVWSCYGNSCECVAVCVYTLCGLARLRWGCSSASCFMTSSRHRTRHIQSVCFLGLCNGYSPPTRSRTHAHASSLVDAPQCCALLPDHGRVTGPDPHRQEQCATEP